jgi:hypothetical protein
VKCIVDPSKVTAPEIAAHAFRCIEGARIVDENHCATVGPFSEKPSADVVCLNHYLVKSHEEMRLRRQRPQVEGIPPIHSVEQWEAFDRDYNAVEDLRIQRFTRIVKRQQLLARLNPLPDGDANEVVRPPGKSHFGDGPEMDVNRNAVSRP